MFCDPGKNAAHELWCTELAMARKVEEQLEELEKMLTTLNQGSDSLNQRATTLATLAVAAIGALGIFSTNIGEIGSVGLAITVAAFAGLAGIAMLTAACFALAAALPGSKWAVTFFKRARAVAKGKLDKEVQARLRFRAVKEQFQRNEEKVTRMKLAYRFTGLALFAATFAVATSLVASVA